MYHSRNRAPHHCKDMKQCCKSVLQWCEAVLQCCKCVMQWCEAILQPCNAQCNDAGLFYTTARGFCNGARQNCTETANFRHPAGNKNRWAAFVSVIN